jgi:hypothetical protein
VTLPCSGIVHGRIDCTHHDQIQWLRGVIAVQQEQIRDLERRIRGEPFVLRALRDPDPTGGRGPRCRSSSAPPST